MGVSVYFINHSGSWIIYGLRLLLLQRMIHEAVGELPRMDHEEGEAVRSTRPEGKIYRHVFWLFLVYVFKKIWECLYIL